MNKFIAMAMAGVALTGFAGAAKAAVTLTATVSTVYSGSPTADLHKTNNPGKTINDVRVTPQLLRGTLSSGPGASVPVEFFAYCVDIFQTAGAATFKVMTLDDYLHNDAKADVLTALIAAEGAKEDKLHDAAVQLAVWEIMNETLPALDIDKVTQTTTEYYRDWRGRLKSRQVTTTPGQFWADDVHSGAGVLANTDAFLAAALLDVQQNRTMPGLDLFVAQSNSKQDFLFWTYTPPPSVVPGVPEPASWAMMVMGFGAMGHAMRRRRSTAVRFA